MNAQFVEAKLILCHWIPMGINNLIALNRHVGAHKSYTSPTAFGMEGSVKDLQKGKVQMESDGALLKPVDYHFSNFLKAELSPKKNPNKTKGLEVQKDGACFIGIDFQKPISTTDIKKTIGELEAEFGAEFIPILTENQQSLLKASYGLDDIQSVEHALSAYSLVITESIGAEITSTRDFLENEETKNVLPPITDWITDHFSHNGNHVFIGMRAMVCVGQPDDQLLSDLKHILFLKSLFNTSLRLHSVIWKYNKRLENIGNNIPSSNYKTLKRFNMQFAEMQNNLSRLQIVFSQLKNTIQRKQEDFDKHTEHTSLYFESINASFNEEIEKSDDRLTMLNQMTVDLNGLRDQVQQKTALIMTKSSQRLNIILLVLTVISVTSVGQILGFSTEMIILGSVVVIPFVFIAIKNYIQYRKDFEG